MEDLIEFYDARDQFLGIQFSFGFYRTNDGLKRLRLCCNLQGLNSDQQEEARFVSTLFTTVLPNTTAAYKEVRQKFLEKSVDPNLQSTLRTVAICYAALFSHGEFDEDLRRKALDSGHSLALGEMSGHFYFASRIHLHFHLAQQSAKYGDRVGLRNLGFCFETGKGCEIDNSRAIAMYKQAALLHDHEAMYRYAKLAFGKDDPARYMWFGKAALRGRFTSIFCFLQDENEFVGESNEGPFVNEALMHMNDYDYHDKKGCGPVLFMIGRMCKSILINYGFSRESSKVMEKTVEIYNWCLIRAKNATLCWILCAKRLGLYKDMSLLIARLVLEKKDTFVHTK